MNVVRTNSLLDLYYKLLTDYQLEVMELYYQENYSLAEIAEEKKVSRNAIFTLIKRVEKILEDYEEKLGLFLKTSLIQEALGTSECLEELKEKIDKIINK